MLKRCLMCGEEKPLDLFYKNKNSKDGHANECKNCAKKRSAEWYKNNRTYALAQCEKYRNSHKEQIEEYRQKQKSKERARIRKQTVSYKQYAKIYKQEYRRRPETKVKEMAYKQSVRYKEYCKEYRKRPEVKSRNKNLYEKRMKDDAIYALKIRTRNLIKESIKKGGYKKETKTQSIVGCSFAHLWEHLLETWDKNYGKAWNGESYHIDHIIPLATAKTEKDIIKLCHYTNLQMLTPEDNLSKGSRLNNHPSFIQNG